METKVCYGSSQPVENLGGKLLAKEREVEPKVKDGQKKCFIDESQCEEESEDGDPQSWWPKRERY